MQVSAHVIRVLGDPRFRVQGQILALQPLGDGTTWTIEEPGLLRQWNTDTGNELQRHELSDLEMLWAIAGDGRALASAADDLTFWDIAAASARKTVSQPSWATALAFRADGDLLVTGHDDGRIRLWDVSGARLIHEWHPGDSAVAALAISKDGLRLAAGFEDRSILLFDLAARNSVGTLIGHTDRISRIAWHPGNRFLATSSWDTTARLWDTSLGEQIFVLNGQADQVHSVTFSPDGQLLATADSEAVIWIWDPFKGKVLNQLRGHQGEITQTAFTPDGSRLLSGGSDGQVILWDAKSGENLLHTGGGSTQTARVQLAPDNKQIAAILGGKEIHFWDAATGRLVQSIEAQPSHATSLVFLSAGTLASGHEDGSLLAWEIPGFRLATSRHQHSSRITSMATDPLGQRFATGGSVDGYVYLWSIDALEPLLLIPGATEGCTVESLAFIPQSPYLACAGVDWRSSGQEGKLCLWNLDRSAKVNSTQTGGLALAANPIGTQLALATLVESICLFQLPDLTLERELLGHCGLVTALSYLADGSLLSAGEDGTLRTWEHKTGKELQVIETQVPIRDFAVSPDGRYAYLANANATISVIDLKQGK